MRNSPFTTIWLITLLVIILVPCLTWSGSQTKLKEGDGVEISGNWDQKGIFVAKSVEKLPEARRPKLRGTITKLSSRDSSVFLFGTKIYVDVKTLFSARGTATGGFQELKVGMRIEVTCQFTEKGLWWARKIDWGPVKASDKIKGTITRLAFDNQPPDTIEISGLKILVTENTDLYGSTRYIEKELFTNLASDEGAVNFPHFKLGNQFLFSGDYRQTTRFENRYTLSEVQKDDYRETEPAIRLEAAGNWSPELQGFLQLRFRKKYAFGTFPYRPSSIESTQVEFQAIQAYLVVRAPAGRKVALVAGKQRLRDHREWLFDEYLDAVRLYVYETKPVFLEATFIPSLFPFQDKKFKTWDDLLLRIRYLPDTRNEANLFFLRRWDSSLRNREPVYWGFSYYGRPKRFVTGWFLASLLRGTDKQRQQEAFAFDVGASFAVVNSTIRPSFTIGYAIGSGDKVKGDAFSQEFRQTGYEDNSGRFGGFSNFQYYGEVLNPELANIQILTVGAGLQPHQLVSVDAIFHAFQQHRPKSDLQLESNGLLSPPVLPSGTDQNLGRELDFILGIQKIWQRLNIAYIFGLFNPGPALSPRTDNAILNRLNIRVEF